MFRPFAALFVASVAALVAVLTGAAGAVQTDARPTATTVQATGADTGDSAGWS
ncbi:hypothetical protein [Streptomyces sp. CC208A]|uniref:hypothetical protein n=1 Tax=Streptomyces sp. CC208A TaxID=3044573 RepID=UPI0024A8970E|nr:hypothetical protein [Streptomyces sp. CC208A]